MKKRHSKHGLHWFNDEKLFAYELEVKAIAKLLHGKRGTFLDAGTGLGHVAEGVRKATRMRAEAFDYEMPCVVKAQKMFPKVRFFQADVYDLRIRKRYDAIISTGYVCVASFPGAPEHLVPILKDDGVMILDFRRDYDLYGIVRGHFFNRWGIYRKRKDGWYHLGMIGIRKYFRARGLEVTRVRRVYTAPPGLPRAMRVWWERWLAPVTGWLLARVLIVEFRKR